MLKNLSVKKWRGTLHATVVEVCYEGYYILYTYVLRTISLGLGKGTNVYPAKCTLHVSSGPLLEGG